jgi:hypothetical protein
MKAFGCDFTSLIEENHKSVLHGFVTTNRRSKNNVLHRTLKDVVPFIAVLALRLVTPNVGFTNSILDV